MADGWIKMRVTLRDDPRVVAIALRLGQRRAAVLGTLYLMWCIADAHGDFMPGVTPQALSELLDLPGFAESLPGEWLQVRPDGLRFPEYEKHNGSTAKRRAVESARKADARKMSATDADKKRGSLVLSSSVAVQQEKTSELPRVREAGTLAGYRHDVNFRGQFLDLWPVSKRAYSKEAEDYWGLLTDEQREAAKRRIKAEVAWRATQRERFKYLMHPEKWLRAYGPDFPEFKAEEGDAVTGRAAGDAGRTFQARAEQGDKFARLEGRA